jgi:hypothetical protein
VVGTSGSVITTATLRDATGWDALVTEQECRLNAGPTRPDGVDRFGRAGEI